MVNSIGTNLNFTGAQGLRAINAFKSDEKTVQKGKQQTEESIENETVSNEQLLRNEISVNKADEIKKYGQIFDMKISNSDINYAFTYGRSVIVDYKA